MNTNRRGFFSWIAGLFAVSAPEILRYSAAWAGTRILPGPEILFADVNETPHLKRKVIVFCDGAEVKRCIRASVTEGYCVVFAQDEAGRYIKKPDGTGAETKRIYGTVRIERKAGT